MENTSDHTVSIQLSQKTRQKTIKVWNFRKYGSQISIVWNHTNSGTIFPYLVSAETILFLIWKSKGQRSQYINVHKLFKGRKKSRAETIRGNTVSCLLKSAGNSNCLLRGGIWHFLFCWPKLKYLRRLSHLLQIPKNDLAYKP